MNIWIAVTGDKYELPYAVADSSEELAKLIGATASGVWQNKKRGTVGRFGKIYMIKVKE